MSETTQQPPAEQPYVPSESLSMEEGEDATQPLQQPQEQAPAEANGTDGEKPAAAEADPEEDRKRTERRREAQRIAYLTKQRYAEKARADALEQRMREYEQQQNGNAQPQQLTREQLEQLVDQRAAAKLAAEQQSQRFNEWDEKGREQFGSKEFTDACRTVAELASDEQRLILRDVAVDTEGGARAIMELAENAEEAERILSLPPHRMALAIAKLGADAKATPAVASAPRVSNAPAPIRPPAVGRARGAADPESGNMDNYMQWSSKQNWRR